MGLGWEAYLFIKKKKKYIEYLNNILRVHKHQRNNLWREGMYFSPSTERGKLGTSRLPVILTKGLRRVKPLHILRANHLSSCFFTNPRHLQLLLTTFDTGPPGWIWVLNSSYQLPEKPGESKRLTMLKGKPGAVCWSLL